MQSLQVASVLETKPLDQTAFPDHFLRSIQIKSRMNPFKYMRALQIILPKKFSKEEANPTPQQTNYANESDPPWPLITRDDGLGVHHTVLLQEDLESEHHGPLMHLSFSVL